MDVEHLPPYAVRKQKLLREGTSRTGDPVRLYEHPTGFQIYLGGWRVAVLKTRAGADGRFDRETTGGTR